MLESQIIEIMDLIAKNLKFWEVIKDLIEQIQDQWSISKKCVTSRIEINDF